MIDADLLNQTSRLAGIDRYTILREYLQILFLDELYQAKDSRKIWFKGGTALRLLFNSPRFSEDLDFSTILPWSKISRLTDQAVVKLETEAPGIKVKNLETVAGFSLKISFPTDFTPMPLTIKLDFSSREPALTNYQNTLTTVLPVFSTALISALTPEEILAEKIRAIISRNKGRDIFDLWFLLKQGIRLNQKLVRAKFRLYQENFSLPGLINSINRFAQNQLNQDLVKFLPLKHRPVVTSLKKLTVAALNQYA